MRFIAVFKQRSTTLEAGFDALIDAINFLFWGYEDHKLVPMGIYDAVTDQVHIYEQAGQFISETDQETIRRAALLFLDRNTQYPSTINQPY